MHTFKHKRKIKMNNTKIFNKIKSKIGNSIALLLNSTALIVLIVSLIDNYKDIEYLSIVSILIILNIIAILVNVIIVFFHD